MNNSTLLGEASKNSLRSGFTLAEVLLAIAIVGVIAALVMPATITKFNKKVLDSGFERQKYSLQTAVDNLYLKQNKTNFFSTSMYLNEEPTSYADSSGKFLKEIVRVGKYCGDSNGDCFAKTYYKYVDKKREEYIPTYKGACAILKNGASLCLIPQIGTIPAKALMDINGPKEPNILDRDLREFSLRKEMRNDPIKETSIVFVHEVGPVDPPTPTPPPTPPDPCTEDPNSLACCQTRTISSATDACCTYEAIKDVNEICKGTKTKLAKLQFGCFGYDYTGRPNPNVPSTCSLYGSNIPSDETIYYDSNIVSGSAKPVNGKIEVKNDFIMKVKGLHLKNLSLASKNHSYKSCSYSSLDKPNKDYCGGGSCLYRQDVRLYLELEYTTNKKGEFIEYTGRAACYVYGDLANGSSSDYIRGRSNKPE